MRAGFSYEALFTSFVSHLCLVSFNFLARRTMATAIVNRVSGQSGSAQEVNIATGFLRSCSSSTSTPDSDFSKVSHSP
jgi:hypothetical protein